MLKPLPQNPGPDPPHLPPRSIMRSIFSTLSFPKASTLFLHLQKKKKGLREGLLLPMLLNKNSPLAAPFPEPWAVKTALYCPELLPCSALPCSNPTGPPAVAPEPTSLLPREALG